MDPEIRKIEDMFSFAGSGVEKLALSKQLNTGKSMIFYGLFKQAMSGDAPEGGNFRNSKEVFKWKHWK